MRKIAFFIVMALWVCSDATMVGDFSPMEVGNKWVYQVVGTYNLQDYQGLRIVKILQKQQRGDSIFYSVSVVDSFQYLIYDDQSKTSITSYLEYHGQNFFFDTLNKSFTPASSIYSSQDFKYNELSDSIAFKTSYLNTSLYSFSLDTSYAMFCFIGYRRTDQWLQNYGHIYSNFWEQGGTCNTMGGGTILTLISFNDQPFDYSKFSSTFNSSPLGLAISEIHFEQSANRIDFRGAFHNDNISFQFFNCLGKMLYSITSIPGDFTFSTSRFSRGAYVLRYQINNKQYHQSKIVLR